MEGLESLFERALRLDPPWRITRIEFLKGEGIIKVGDNKLWRMMYYDTEAAHQLEDYSIPGIATPQCGISSEVTEDNWG